MSPPDNEDGSTPAEVDPSQTHADGSSRDAARATAQDTPPGGITTAVQVRELLHEMYVGGELYVGGEPAGQAASDSAAWDVVMDAWEFVDREERAARRKGRRR